MTRQCMEGVKEARGRRGAGVVLRINTMNQMTARAQKPHQTAAITKKPRVHRTPELQQKFVEATDRIDKRKNPGGRIGSDESEEKVVPKEILAEMRQMGVTGLTRQSVSSHLQKDRMNKKKQGPQSGPLGPMNYSSPCQYSSLPIQSYPPAPIAPYPAHTRYLQSQNFAISQAVRQPNNYFSIGQQVGALPVGPMTTQQLASLLDQINQLPDFRNLSPHHVIGSAAPGNLHFGPPSVFANQNQPLISGPPSTNQSNNFSLAFDHCQSVPAAISLNEDIAHQHSFDGLDDLPWFGN